MSALLKPCPHCDKSTGINLQGEELKWSISCGLCRSNGPIASTQERAGDLWNKRPAHDHAVESGVFLATLVLKYIVAHEEKNRNFGRMNLRRQDIETVAGQILRRDDEDISKKG